MSKPDAIESVRLAQNAFNSFRLPPIADDELVRRALVHANELSINEAAEALMLSHSFMTHGVPTEFVHSSQPGEKSPLQLLAQIDQRRFVDSELQKLAPEREWFRRAVLSLMNDAAAARESLTPEISEALTSVVAVPRITWNGTSLEVDLRLAAGSARGFLAYALALLLDESRGLGARLRVCALPGCDRIFLTRPLGPGSGQRGKPASHCSPQHGAAAHALGAPTRKKRSAARKHK